MKPSIFRAFSRRGAGGSSASAAPFAGLPFNFPRSAFCLLALSLSLPLLAGTEGRAAERRFMVSAANPHAAEAGAEVLRKGGSAADAAVAVQTVLGLVEPQSSGIGGGAFLLYYDAATSKVHAYDGREMAPGSAGPDLFTGADGKALKWRKAMLGGRAVGAPGTVALLAKVHSAHGKRPWDGLFDRGISLANDGFRVSPRLNMLLGGDKWLGHRKASGAYFYHKGADGAPTPLPVGHLLKNPAYGATITRIAQQGPKGFYEGPVAEAIVAAVAGAENPGLLSLTDLAGYEAKERAAVCRAYHQWKVCGMPPPTSGGVTILQTLGLLEGFDLKSRPPGSVEAVHLIAEASRLAFADRNTYLADPDFVDQPVKGLLSPSYIAARAKQISPNRSMGKAAAGEPLEKKSNLAPNVDVSFPATSHFSIVDGWGNAVSMTTSIEAAFGSHEMAAGFLLNNQLTDFSFREERDGKLVANRVQAKKRPRSSMSPMIVLDAQGKFVAAIGSPGGSRIIGYVTQAIVSMLDWDLPMAEVVGLPHFVNRNGSTDLEEGTSAVALKGPLEALGHKVATRRLTSGLHGVMVRDGKLEGGADPRREGVVIEGVVVAGAN